jgi:hypothetical protein
MKRLKLFSVICMLSTCATAPLTGGKQISLVDESHMQQQAVQAYREFLNTATTKVISNSADARRVKLVGGNIASAITRDICNRMDTVVHTVMLMNLI